MSFVSLRAKIKAMLDARKTATILGEVFDGEQDQQNMEISAYPVAELRRTQSEGDFFTNKEDIVSYDFDIIIYAEMTDQGASAAEKQLDAVLDDLLYQFAKDRTLTGTADAGVDPGVTNGGIIEWRGKPHYVSILRLRCKKILDLT